MINAKQTAKEIAMEYSQELKDLADSYEVLSGSIVQADDEMFWNSGIVNKVETLTAFWWWLAKQNDPVFQDEYIEEDTYEEN